MHAWADIEHKLAYKTKDQIPPQFRRQLYQLSALLEIADSQFQTLKIEREALKESLIIETSQNEKVFDANQELNLDTLQALLDFYFPNQSINTQTTDLLSELKSFKIDLNQLNEYILKFNILGIKPEKELGFDDQYLKQAGMVRFILDVMDDSRWEIRRNVKGINPENWIPTIIAVREKMLERVV